MKTRSCGALALLALLAAAAPAHADAKADALLKKAREVAARTKSLKADLLINPDQKNGAPPIRASFELLKPNFGRILIEAPLGKQEIISDGKEMFFVRTDAKEYQKQPADLAVLVGPPGSPIQAFLQPESLATAGARRYAGTQKGGGVTYEVVKVTAPEAPRNRKLFFGPSGLLEGVEFSEEGGQTVSMWLKNLKLGAPLKPEQFAYTPPDGFTMPKGPEDSLLAVGKEAPDFRLPRPGGSELALTDTLKDKKAVLINFWFYA